MVKNNLGKHFETKFEVWKCNSNIWWKKLHGPQNLINNTLDNIWYTVLAFWNTIKKNCMVQKYFLKNCFKQYSIYGIGILKCDKKTACFKNIFKKNIALDNIRYMGMWFWSMKKLHGSKIFLKNTALDNIRYTGMGF